MTSEIHDLIRSTLSDLAEEARPVDLTDRVLHGVRRPTVKIALGVVATAAALAIATPFALASGDGGDRTPPGVPVEQSPVPSPPPGIGLPAR